MFLPLSGGTPPALLTLIQYSAKDWKAIARPASPPGTVVAEGGGRVFVACCCRPIPFPAGSEDAVAIAPMLLTRGAGEQGDEDTIGREDVRT